MGEVEKNIKASKRFLDKVGKYYDAEDFEKALDFTNRSIEKDPNNAEAHFVKGNILMAMEEPYKAIREFNVAMELGYRDEIIYTNRGTAFKKIEKFDNSLSDYNLALEIKPDFYPAYALRGELFLKIDNYTSAIKDFNSALKIEPDDFDLILSKCKAYEKSSNLPKALEVINDFILDRDYEVPSDFIMERGFLYSKCNYPHQAIQDFSLLIDETDCLLTAYEWRYKEYEKIGDFKNAKKDKEKINDLKNNDGCSISYVYPIGD